MFQMPQAFSGATLPDNQTHSCRHIDGVSLHLATCVPRVITVKRRTPVRFAHTHTHARTVTQTHTSPSSFLSFKLLALSCGLMSFLNTIGCFIFHCFYTHIRPFGLLLMHSNTYGIYSTFLLFDP